MIMFAEVSSNVPPNVSATWAWGLAGVAVMLGGVFWCWNQARSALNGGNRISPQPLAVELTKELNEQFADKHEFERHVKHNTERHAQFFNEVNRVEREGRLELDRRLMTLAVEQRQRMEKLDDKLDTQFTFIRENIAAINRELKIRGET